MKVLTERVSYRPHDHHDCDIKSDPHAGPPPRKYLVPLTQQQPYLRRKPSRRISWPRYAFVEDEKASLEKEVQPVKADADQVEVRSRGSIDQVPILLRVGRKSGTAHQTEDPELGKTTDTVDFADPAVRKPAPYTFTPPRASPSEAKPSPTDSAYSSSTDLIAEKRKQARALNDIAMSDALRGEGKTRGAQHLSRNVSFPSDARRARETAIPFREEHDAAMRRQRSTREIPAPRPKLAALKADAMHPIRSSSETASTLPRENVKAGTPTMPTSRKPPTLTPMAASSTHEKVLDNRSDTSSRPMSPVSNTGSYDSSSPDTPGGNHSVRFAPDSRRWSSRASQAGSKTSSRSSSPDEHIKRSSTFPNLQQEDRQVHHRRYPGSSASVVGSELRDAYAPYPPKPVTTAPVSTLPYPVDDMGLTGSENDLRYRPRIQDVLSMPPTPTHRETPSAPPSPTAEKRTIHGGLVKRPQMPSRRTANDALLTLSTGRLTNAGTVVASPTTLPTQTSARTPRQPPPCRRAMSTKSYSDWYTLEGLAKFNICPDCLHTNFDDTEFHDFFKRAKPKDANERVKCDFSCGWNRLAWLVTQQQQRGDLRLLYDVATIGMRDSCTGDHSEEGVWYALQDQSGQKIQRFDVCPADVKRVDTLMPQLHDKFVKAYGGNTKVRKCDLRTRSHRFAKYLEILYAIVKKADNERRAPDVQVFVEYAKQRAQIRECRQDELFEDKAWHFIPGLPEFTVCEECYTDVVWPQIDKECILAGRFQQTPRKLYGNPSREYGRSCQLYSKPMRDIFNQACNTEDFEKLRWCATERRAAELHFKSTERAARR